MTQMKRSLLDSELTALNSDIVQLGSMVDTAIGKAVEALLTGNVTMANEVIAGDSEINRLRFQVEEKSYVVLSTQQPLARDLRTVIAAIHFAIELERIGDHAAGIARIVTRLEGIPTVQYDATTIQLPVSGEAEAAAEAEAIEEPAAESSAEDADAAADEGPHFKLSRLPKMSKRAREMLQQAIEAFIDRDVDKARAIIKRDHKLDRQYRKFFIEAMSEMSAQHVAELPTYLLWIAHNLERIGDRTTNLAERVIFMVTGQYTEVLEDYE